MYDYYRITDLRPGREGKQWIARYKKSQVIAKYGMSGATMEPATEEEYNAFLDSQSEDSQIKEE